MGSLGGDKEGGSLKWEKMTKRQAQIHFLVVSAWLAWKRKGSCYVGFNKMVQQDCCLLANHQITSWLPALIPGLSLHSFLFLPVLHSSSIYCRWRCDLPAVCAPYPSLWKYNTSPLIWGRKIIPHSRCKILVHSSPVPPVQEWERHAACVMKRKDNVILLYDCYDYDYYFIIIIFYSGF